MKYVIIQQELTGHYLPVVFANELVHRSIAQAVVKANRPCKVLSAGFLERNKGGSWLPTDEHSDSLGIGPSPLDGLILKLFLEGGYSGLQLSNLITFTQIQLEKSRKE